MDCSDCSECSECSDLNILVNNINLSSNNYVKMVNV